MNTTGDSIMNPDQGQDLSKKVKELDIGGNENGRNTGTSGGESGAGAGSIGSAEPGTSGSGPSSTRDGSIKGILKNKNEKSPIAPNAFTYMGPSEQSIRDNNTEQDRRFSKVVDSKELYARKLRAGQLKKGKYNQARRSTQTSSVSAENTSFSFRPKRQNDSSDSDAEQGGSGSKDHKPPFTA